jgi:hypothetical protein
MVSASDRNEYQEYFLGCKGGRWVGLTIYRHVPTVLKYRSLKLLEPSGLSSLYRDCFLLVKYHLSNFCCYILHCWVLIMSNQHIGERLRWSRGCVLASSTQVRGFKPGRSLRIFQGEKIPQHAFLRRGSKAGGPMS